MPEPLFCEVPRYVSMFDENRNTGGADRIDVLLHEARDRCKVAALFKLQESCPQCADGPPGKRREVVDRRDAKLVHGMQKLDVAVLEFKTVFCGHGVGGL